MRGEKNWPRFKSKYFRPRKKDPLLLYLVQARNVSEHSISPAIKEWDADLKATSIPGGIKLNWDQWDRPLRTIQNRGVTYNPPKKHLDIPISQYKSERPGTAEPTLVAELAMLFYVKALNEINANLFPSNY